MLPSTTWYTAEATNGDARRAGRKDGRPLPCEDCAEHHVQGTSLVIATLLIVCPSRVECYGAELAAVLQPGTCDSCGSSAWEGQCRHRLPTLRRGWRAGCSRRPRRTSIEPASSPRGHTGGHPRAPGVRPLLVAAVAAKRVAVPTSVLDLNAAAMLMKVLMEMLMAMFGPP